MKVFVTSASAPPTAVEEEKVEEAKVNNILLLITSFFERISEDQWTLLKSGDPDHATKIMLAELLLEIIRSVAQVVVASLNRNFNGVVSVEYVRSTMGETITEGIAEALNVSEKVTCASSVSLMKLISEHVTKSVNASLPSLQNQRHEIPPDIIPPGRLNAMVNQTWKTITAVGAGVKKLCKPRPREEGKQQSQVSDQIVSKQSDQTQSGLLVQTQPKHEEQRESTPSDDVCKSEEISSREDHSPENVSSEQSFREAVMDIMKLEGEKIAHCFDSAFNGHDMLIESSTDIIVAEPASVEPTCAQTHVAVDPAPKQREERQNRIKTFLAKCFTRAWLDQILKKFKIHQPCKAATSPSLDEVTDNVEEILKEDCDEIKRGEYEICPYEMIQNVSPERLLQYSRELSDILYLEMTGDLPPYIEEGGKSRSTVAISVVPQSNFDIYCDLRDKALSFFTLMCWWLNTQATSHTSAVIRAIEDIEVRFPPATPEVEETQPEEVEETQPEEVEETEPEEVEEIQPEEVEETKPEEVETFQTKKNKSILLILIEKLVSRIFHKARLNFSHCKPEDIVTHLFEITWSEVKDLDFCISPEKLWKLDKITHKALCEEWGTTETVVLIYGGNPAVDKFIAATIKHHLTEPNKGNAFCRFFSSVGKVISKPFRKTSAFRAE